MNFLSFIQKTGQQIDHVDADFIDSIAAFHDDQSREAERPDPPRHPSVVGGGQLEMADRVGLVRVGPIADDQQVRSLALDPVERLGQCRRIAAPVRAARQRQVEVVARAQQVINPDKQVGIYVGAKRAVRDEHLEAVGIRLDSNYIIEGAIDDGACKEFENLWIEGVRPEKPQAVYEKAEKEFVAVGKKFFSSHPNMGAMVLECTGFPPFARALQRQIDIPIFSYSTLLDFAFSIVAHRDFYGHV